MIKITVWCIQLIIWSGYTVIEMISNRDQLLAKVILFFVFAYLAYLVAETTLKKKKSAFSTTLMTFTTFFICQRLAWLLIEISSRI
ncbi:hypothetical protein [Bacillus sp. CGMCC 1.16541]|uniref:hypothetical protein n=1 Tax=Bacillus sp. CGMCC 1.16541 TaxID=2185143 RepID=UPI000D73C176|nr:hypothetical protein [Bacillus sp. CGMCC 1.16541]